jgi:preprotein translocase subunit SecY
MSYLSKGNNLYNKIAVTLLVLLFYRLGSYVPVPGVNCLALDNILQSGSGIMSVLNSLSGGSVARMSIFSLAIMPYITASIIMQLLSMSYKPLEDLKKEGEGGRAKITQLTRYLALVLATIQSYGVVAMIIQDNNSLGSSLLTIDYNSFKFIAVLTMTAGTVVVIWLSDLITRSGLGNGSSLIIFIGIVSSLPSALINSFESIRVGATSLFTFMIVICVILFLIFFILLFEQAQRKILVQYPKRQVGNKVFSSDSTYVPLKINTAGVIPPIFASALLSFPSSMVGFSGFNVKILDDLLYYFSQNSIFYYTIFTCLIIFFSFFYTSAVFNAKETAENLRKYNAYVPGKKPGNQTAEFFDYVLTRLTCLGSIYLAFVCVIPDLFISKYITSFSLGGTSLLIIVNVILDTLSQIQSHLFSDKYDAMMKKVKMKRK